MREIVINTGPVIATFALLPPLSPSMFSP
jgi:hypothetical protein